MKKDTKLGNSYYNETGVYQTEYNSLYKELVPTKDEAKTTFGEMIRSISILYYDFCNNGNCNVLDHKYETETQTCYSCGGSGETTEYDEDDEPTEVSCEECCGSGELDEEVQSDVFITPYYLDFVEYLKLKLNYSQSILDLDKFLLNNNNDYTYDDKQMNIYDKVVDDVVYYCLTNENSAIQKPM
jgi:hypothetical protein